MIPLHQTNRGADTALLVRPASPHTGGDIVHGQHGLEPADRQFRRSTHFERMRAIEPQAIDSGRIRLPFAQSECRPYSVPLLCSRVVGVECPVRPPFAAAPRLEENPEPVENSLRPATRLVPVTSMVKRFDRAAWRDTTTAFPTASEALACAHAISRPVNRIRAAMCANLSISSAVGAALPQMPRAAAYRSPSRSHSWALSQTECASPGASLAVTRPSLSTPRGVVGKPGAVVVREDQVNIVLRSTAPSWVDMSQMAEEAGPTRVREDRRCWYRYRLAIQAAAHRPRHRRKALWPRTASSPVTP